MKHITLLAACFSATLASTTFAQEVTPNDVVYSEYGAVETSLTGVAGDAENGALLFKNRKLGNCLACHANSDMSDQGFHGEVGPPLDGVGANWSEAELRGILTNSKNTFDGTIMPAFYVEEAGVRTLEKFAGKSILAAQDVEDILAYLLTLTE
ncbi:MAG: sulfur oxidation c-type cytochrome SoxX [Rhodobacteraceae bacterium]|nr:sulfur oxidation c-type cytochrome SoxX [Paracoccaceae bacterium]